jgi:hypothetical protein
MLRCVVQEGVRDRVAEYTRIKESEEQVTN